MQNDLAVFVEYEQSTVITGLLVTDGTAENSYVLPLGFPGSVPHNLVVLDGQVLFAFETQSSFLQTLWISDGTAQGTHEITGIGNASIYYGLDPQNLTVVGDQAFFIGNDAADNVGLWVTDGTAAGTQEVVAGVSGSDLTAFNGKLLFNNNGLWVTDGTAAGTSEVTPISGIFGGYIRDLTVFNNEALFAQVLSGDNNQFSGLWVTDGTADGTHEVTGIVGASPDGITPSNFTVFEGEVLFTGIDADQKFGLWITDGTGAGTHELTGIANAPATGLAAGNFVVFNNEALFAALDANNQIGLWVTDGTGAGTHELTGIVGASQSTTGFTPGLAPYHLLAFNGEVLFNGTDLAGNIGLWATDGTAAGTHELTGIVGNPSFVGNVTTDPVAIPDLQIVNHAPVIGASNSTLTGTIYEGPSTTEGTQVEITHGAISFVDADLGDRPTASVTARTLIYQDSFGNPLQLTDAQIATLENAFSITAEAGNTNTGKIDWTYAVDDFAISFLNAGEKVEVASTIEIADGHGGKVDQDVNVTIQGPVELTERNVVAEMAELAYNAYGDATAAIGRNWHAVSAAELGLSPSGSENGVSYSLNNGLYVGSLGFLPADALVLSGVVDGEKTLSIAFGGTFSGIDPLVDLQPLDWPLFDLQFSKYQPLISALGQYIITQGIEQVLVTGHSMGGAMVQDFLAQALVGVGATNVRGYTWGTSGADEQPANQQLINFEHVQDPVPSLGSLKYATDGIVVGLDSAILQAPPDMMFPIAHNPRNYLQDTLVLVERAEDQHSIFYTTPLAAAIRSGDFWNTNVADSVVVLTNDLDSEISISSADQFVLGGRGNDTFDWTDGPTSTWLTNIEGGGGHNALVLPGPKAAWSWLTHDAGFDLFSTNTLVARLYDIESLRFDDAIVNLLAPTAAVSAGSSVLKAGQVDTITFTFSKSVLGFNQADLNVTGGTLGSITAIDPTHYVATFTPDSTDNLVATIQVLDSGTGTSYWTDLIGDQGTASNVFAITGDTLPLEVTEKLALDTGISATDKITSNATLTGSGDPNAIVHFMMDGNVTVATATANGSGTWTFTPTGLVDGIHTIAANETDLTGNVGSASLTFTLDSTPPQPEVTSIVQNGNGAKASVTFGGLSESGSNILKIVESQIGGGVVGTDGNGSTTVLATTSAAGAWSVTTGTGFSYSSGNAYKVDVTAEDVAGNTSMISTFFGGTKPDKIVGTSGNDFIFGSLKGDTLTGGGGSDTYVYTGAADSQPGAGKFDTITDFVRGFDKFDFSAIAGLNTNNQAVAINILTGATPASIAAHTIDVLINGGNAILYANVTALTEILSNGHEDMQINLPGVTALTASDFILHH